MQAHFKGAPDHRRAKTGARPVFDPVNAADQAAAIAPPA
jgi:hypothetical protein